MIMRRFFLPLALALIGTFQLGATVTLPSFFSDNMVLQQNTDAAIWGWTDSGKDVVITTTWTGVKFSATPD